MLSASIRITHDVWPREPSGSMLDVFPPSSMTCDAVAPRKVQSPQGKYTTSADSPELQRRSGHPTMVDEVASLERAHRCLGPDTYQRLVTDPRLSNGPGHTFNFMRLFAQPSLSDWKYCSMDLVRCTSDVLRILR